MHVDIVIGIVRCHQQLAEHAVRVADVAGGVPRVPGDHRLERGTVVLCRQHLETVVAILIFVDEELPLDPIRGPGVLRPDVVTQRAQRQAEAGQPLLAIDHEPSRWATDHSPCRGQHQ